MRLATVVYSTDHEVFTQLAVIYLQVASDPDLTKIVVIDNGSKVPFAKTGDINIRYEENIGGNAVFHRWMTDGWFPEEPEFIAFLHCDLFVHEHHWDDRVLAAFDADPKLDLIGFVGSNQIDTAGGRGGGTMLNFTGALFEGIGVGSPAEAHGRRIRGLHPAAVVDHCAMILRTSTLKELTPQEGNYAPEHFYDRLLSCEILQRGGHIGVLGVECDHFSGGIGPGMTSANALRTRWLKAEGVPFDPTDTYTAVYVESERRFFAKYRSFFPVWVDDQYQIHHP
jgi:hypothetical protein